MQLTRLLRYVWLLDLDPVYREIVLQMLAETEIQTLKRLARETRDQKLLAELEELEESL